LSAIKKRHCIASSLLVVLMALTVLLSRVATASDTPEQLVQKSITLKFLTYNVCMLPDFITFDRNLLVPTEKRAALIAKLIKDYDVIGLQEAFIPQREVFPRRLKNHFMVMGTGSPKANPTGSGLYIFSKGDIQRSVFERWREQYGVDAFSHKGFMGATTVLPGGLEIDVYTLHAQAGFGPKPRIENYKQMMAAVQRFSGGTRRPIIIHGDFNCNPGEEDCEWILQNSSLKMASSHLDHVDHLFYDENGSDWTITIESARWVFDELVSGRLISDHNGMETIIRFDKR